MQTAAPALLWIHGGGLIFSAPEQDDRTNIAFARELGITVAAVRYRLAPDSPAPAAVEDAYAALQGLIAHADELRIDIGRIAIGGASAGGGIAAALALLAHDRAEIRPVFQLLVYPMLDDRTTTRTDLDTRNLRLWTAKRARRSGSCHRPSSRALSPVTMGTVPYGMVSSVWESGRSPGYSALLCGWWLLPERSLTAAPRARGTACTSPFPTRAGARETVHMHDAQAMAVARRRQDRQDWTERQRAGEHAADVPHALDGFAVGPVGQEWDDSGTPDDEW